MWYDDLFLLMKKEVPFLVFNDTYISVFWWGLCCSSLVFCVVLLCVFTFWLPCCDVRYEFRIKGMIDLSLAPVDCVCLCWLYLFTCGVVQHILCCVFRRLCCQFLWIVHFWLPFHYSLPFIYGPKPPYLSKMMWHAGVFPNVYKMPTLKHNQANTIKINLYNFNWLVYILYFLRSCEMIHVVMQLLLRTQQVIVNSEDDRFL